MRSRFRSESGTENDRAGRPLELVRVRRSQRRSGHEGRPLDRRRRRRGGRGRRRGTDRGDVLSILLLARDEEGGLCDTQIRDEVMTLLLAGHETTANALTWTWFELGRHPDVLAKLAAEVDTLGKKPVTVDDLAHLPFNLAVIEEGMRLHPPAYMVGREAS